MKKFLSFFGFAAVAAVSGAVAYLYMNDKGVQEKVNRAVVSVGDAVTEIKSSLQDVRHTMGAEASSDPVARNQAWVDEQWEAIGI